MARIFNTEEGNKYVVTDNGEIRLNGDEYVYLTAKDLEEMLENLDDETPLQTYRTY